MSSINIQYTKVPSSSYSQQTLGDNSGTRIETDQIRLEPWLVGAALVQHADFSHDLRTKQSRSPPLL